MTLSMLQLHRAELYRSARRLHSDFDDWLVGPEKKLERLDDARSGAITSVMRELLDGLDRLLGRLDRDEISHEQCMASLLQAERAWAFFRHLLAQRGDLTVGRDLERADACATDGYLHFARRAGQSWAPPIVSMEPIDSPESYARHGRVESPGLCRGEDASQEIPIPIVLMPPSHTSCPWLLTTLQHEVGHSLDHDFGVTAALQPALVQALNEVGPGVLARQLWLRWLPEMVADAFAVLLSGSAFAWSMGLIIDRLERWRHLDYADVHPPAVVRMKLIREMIRQRGEGPQDAALAPLDQWIADKAKTTDVLRVATEFEPHIKPLVAALLRSRVDKFGGTLAETAPSAADDAVKLLELHDWLLSEEAVPRSSTYPLRLLPSAAQLALVAIRDRGPAQLDALAERALKLLHHVKGPAWVHEDADWSALRERVRQMKPPLLSSGPRPKKVPPQQLLLRHEQVSFVGATNENLPAALAVAFEARQRRRWTSIDVYFLAESALLQIDSDGRRASAEAQRKAVLELRRQLPTWSEHSSLFMYAEPFYFASYWDVGEPNGRIHVSPYVWGENIQTCPAMDFVREGSEPSETYATYARGLAALRKSATPIHDDPM